MLALSQELESRWLLNQYTDDKLFELYDQGGQKFYFGMDPTADSLHLWNFVNFMTAVHLMRRGNTLIPLVGWATGMIWDPGGKDTERVFLDEELLEHNVQALQTQIDGLIDNIKTLLQEELPSTNIINNKDFYHNMNILDFLRDVGKFITVNSMMTRETVKHRIEDPDKSISYTEFSYMMIQWYDFYRLYTEYDCKLQIAWSDQRWNLTVGTELIRKKTNGEAYGLTSPLILDSTGKKFGKSAGNAIFLDSSKNSPYAMYQYFLNTSDEDVERFLKIFTFYEFDEITAIIRKHKEAPELRYGQDKLAEYVVALIAGKDAVKQAQKITEILYGTGDRMDIVKQLHPDEIQALAYELWSVQFDKDTDIRALLVQSWLASSNGEAKKLIQWWGIYLNEQKVTDITKVVTPSDMINNLILLRKGKKAMKIVL